MTPHQAKFTGTFILLWLIKPFMKVCVGMFRKSLFHTHQAAFGYSTIWSSHMVGRRRQRLGDTPSPDNRWVGTNGDRSALWTYDAGGFFRPQDQYIMPNTMNVFCAGFKPRYFFLDACPRLYERNRALALWREVERISKRILLSVIACCPISIRRRQVFRCRFNVNATVNNGFSDRF